MNGRGGRAPPPACPSVWDEQLPVINQCLLLPWPPAVPPQLPRRSLILARTLILWINGSGSHGELIFRWTWGALWHVNFFGRWRELVFFGWQAFSRFSCDCSLSIGDKYSRKADQSTSPVSALGRRRGRGWRRGRRGKRKKERNRTRRRGRRGGERGGRIRGGERGRQKGED